MLLGREHFFLAYGAPERFHVTQNVPVNFYVKLNFNVFHAASPDKAARLPS
jgi:hypothetical protein